MLDLEQLKVNIKQNKFIYMVVLGLIVAGAIFFASARYKCTLEDNSDGSTWCYKYKKVNGQWKPTGEKWPDECPAPPTCP